MTASACSTPQLERSLRRCGPVAHCTGPCVSCTILLLILCPDVRCNKQRERFEEAPLSYKWALSEMQSLLAGTLCTKWPIVERTLHNTPHVCVHHSRQACGFCDDACAMLQVVANWANAIFALLELLPMHPAIPKPRNLGRKVQLHLLWHLLALLLWGPGPVHRRV